MERVLVAGSFYSTGCRSTERLDHSISTTELERNHRLEKPDFPPGLLAPASSSLWSLTEQWSLFLAIEYVFLQNTYFLISNLFPPKVICKISTLLYGNKRMASDHYVPSEAQTRCTKPFLQWSMPRLRPTLATTANRMHPRIYLSWTFARISAVSQKEWNFWGISNSAV